MRRGRRAGFAALLLAMVTAWASADWWMPPQRIDGRVQRIHDGDSFAMDGQDVRLAGIDAPEYHQSCADAAGQDWACGQVARAALVTLLDAGALSCEVEARDRYDRAIATCRNRAGDVGAAMVRQGMAISPSVRGTARYDAEQDAAQHARRGLWQGRFTPPDQWRAAHAILQ